MTEIADSIPTPDKVPVGGTEASRDLGHSSVRSLIGLAAEAQPFLQNAGLDRRIADSGNSDGEDRRSGEDRRTGEDRRAFPEAGRRAKNFVKAINSFEAVSQEERDPYNDNNKSESKIHPESFLGRVLSPPVAEVVPAGNEVAPPSVS